MRRIKMILAVVSAVATMLVMAAPAMAQVTQDNGATFTPATESIGGVEFVDGIVTDDGFGFDAPILFGGFGDGVLVANPDFDGNTQFVATNTPDSFRSFSAS